ncbi:MAG: XdhC family protein [Oscillatoria princeps RMCB-10]|jgi:xanthine/CO dehydrogenase XdhC/CoxF family maturation factor|nr:XdhC family protein [Oscillatoria princeps RMCB-10]
MKELQDIIEAFQKLESRGKTAALATLVKLQGSSYRQLGARMLVTEEGAVAGSLSGGCLEDDVFERAGEVMRSGNPIAVEYDTKADQDIIWGLGLGCNGIVRILIECLTHESQSHIRFISECFHRRQVGVVATVFSVEGELSAKVGDRLMLRQDDDIISNIGDCELAGALREEALEVLENSRSKVKLYPLKAGNAEVFIEVIQPPVRLLLFGAGSDAVPVVRFAKELGWQVTVIDSRPAYATSARFPLADRVIVAGAETIDRHIQPDSRTVAAVMTHHYLRDLEILNILLTSPLRYVGLLGSKGRTEKLLAELHEKGIIIKAENLARFYSPVGLDIGAETPEEIALAVIAEIQAVLAGRQGGFLKSRCGSIHQQIE